MSRLDHFKATKIMAAEKVKAEKKSAKREARFTGVLLKEAAAACKATRNQQAFVWIWLQYLAWDAGYKPFEVTNERLKDYDITRKTKWRALKAFEKAGLISIVRYERNSPVVAMLVPVKRWNTR
jgi:hypothetical protein